MDKFVSIDLKTLMKCLEKHNVFKQTTEKIESMTTSVTIIEIE